MQYLLSCVSVGTNVCTRLLVRIFCKILCLLSPFLRRSSQLLSLGLCRRIRIVWSRVLRRTRMALPVQFSPSCVDALFVITLPLKSSLFDLRACMMSAMILTYLVWMRQTPGFLLSPVARNEFFGRQVKRHRLCYYREKIILVDGLA